MMKKLEDWKFVVKVQIGLVVFLIIGLIWILEGESMKRSVGDYLISKSYQQNIVTEEIEEVSDDFRVSYVFNGLMPEEQNRAWLRYRSIIIELEDMGIDVSSEDVKTFAWKEALIDYWE